LQKDRRFLVKRTDGSFDPVALRNAHVQLAFAPVDSDTRTRLQKSVARLLCVGDAVKKGAWSYGDMEAAGKLHTGFGFPVVIEVPDGGTRSGTSKDGTTWETKLNGMSYGFLPDTIAADAEELDAIVGKDITAPMAFVIDQGDECKLALGYANAQDARGVYEKNWPAGMLKEMYEVPMDVVRALLGASPSSLAKSIYAAKRMSGMSGGTVVVNGGEVIGEIRKNVGQDSRKNVTAISMEQLRDVAVKLLRDRLAPDVPSSTPAYQVDIWIVDTYDDVLVYSFQNELWRIGYSVAGTDVTLVDDPVRVNRTYEDVAKGAMDAGTFEGGGMKRSGQSQDATTAPVTSGMFERDKIAALYKHRTKRDVQFVSVRKAAEDKPMLVYGVVLEPEPNNGAGDLHRETYDETFVRETAHDFCAWYMNLDDQHEEFLPPSKAVVVETYTTKQPEQWAERLVKAASWIVGIRVHDPELKRQILAGEKKGLSIEGFAERVPNTQSANPLPEHRAPEP
jgi:hypothetical protein